MIESLALIGFGEAGRSFANAAGWGQGARVFDSAPIDYTHATVRPCTTSADALSGAIAILSLVTADQALAVAQDAAYHIAPSALFFDMNSVAPETKCAASAVITAAGGRYVDVAIMSPVNPALMDVPLLVSGPYADEGATMLHKLGFANVRIVGDDVGRASTIKMLRSVMYKGVEALTAECLIACERAGVTDEVLGSFKNDWSAQADYRLDRMLVHGSRRAAEMREVVKTLEGLGMEAWMTRGTVERQYELGSMAISPVPDGLEAKLERLKRA